MQSGMVNYRMVDEPRQSRLWEQLPDEPPAAFVRFQVYLNFGRARSLRVAQSALPTSATKRDKTRHLSKSSVNGQWASDCTKYRWVERARAWDIEQLADVGYDAVVNFINMLALLSSKTLTALASEKIKPKSLKTIMEVVNLLGSFIPAETVAAVRADASERRTPSIGHSLGGDGESPNRTAGA